VGRFSTDQEECDVIKRLEIHKSKLLGRLEILYIRDDLLGFKIFLLDSSLTSIRNQKQLGEDIIELDLLSTIVAAEIHLYSL
jgi:hypothetical protein